MSAWVKWFYGDGPADYGRGVSITFSVVLHLVALGLLVWTSRLTKEPPKESLMMTVRLGGPVNMKVSGKKRKAPVAGVTKPPKTTPTPTAKPEPKKPEPAKNEVGLKREVKKDPKPNPVRPSPETAVAKPDKSKKTETLPPPPDEKGARAIGGLDGSRGTGVSLEVGDGSQEVNTEDIEFISYFRTIHAELASRWIKSGLEGGTTRIRFFIHRDGRVSDASVVQSSGKSYLDGPAMRAVLGAEFPPLPQGYRGERLILNINFQYGEKK